MQNLFIFFLSIFLWSPLVFADLGHRTLPLFHPKRLQLGVEAQSFSSDTNFLSNGTKDVLPSGYKFLTYDIILNSMYDFSDDWAASLDLNLAYAESYNNIDRRNSRKIKDLKLGFFKLYDTKYLGRFIFDGFYLLNFVSNDLDVDQVSVSDGVSWAQLGVWWEPKKGIKSIMDDKKTVSKFSPTIRAYVGFRNRSNYSDLLIYKIHPQFAYKKFVMGLEANGIVSVIKEDAQEQVNKEVLNQRYNASNFRYNSWNPAVLEGMVWLGYRPQPYSQLRIGASQILGSENTAQGMGVFIDWQTSMTITSSGMLFSDFFSSSKKGNPRSNKIEIKNYGPEPKVEPKVKPSDLQDL